MTNSTLKLLLDLYHKILQEEKTKVIQKPGLLEHEEETKVVEMPEMDEQEEKT